jgi:DNA mismatch repair protein MutS
MDKFTIRNLELIGNGADRKGLLEIMDATKSPMGARLLKRWLVFPLQSITQINKRLDAVGSLLEDSTGSSELRELIESCGDLERLASKLSTRKIQPRELMQLAKSLEAVTTIKEQVSNSTNSFLQEIGKELIPNYFQILVKVDSSNPKLLNSRNFYSNGEVNVMGKDLKIESLKYDLVYENKFTSDDELIIRQCSNLLIYGRVEK